MSTAREQARDSRAKALELAIKAGCGVPVEDEAILHTANIFFQYIERGRT